MSICMEDTIYYCISPKNKLYKAWVFDDFAHCFPDLKTCILAKPIYYRDLGTHLDFPNYKHKKLGDGNYINLIYKMDTRSEFTMQSSREIKEFLCNRIPGLSMANPYSNDIFGSSFIGFDKRNILAKSSPKQALANQIQVNEKYVSLIANIAEVLHFYGDMGLTGSLSLGASSYNDIDVVFYGNTDTLNQVMYGVRTQIANHGAVVENGLKWPCRFYDRYGNIICCFFNFSDGAYHKYIPTNRTALEQISFTAQVTDDTFSIAKTPVLELNHNVYDRLIIWGRAFRGVFRKGDCISGTGYLATNDKMNRTIICAAPFQDIENWNSYFNR